MNKDSIQRKIKSIYSQAARGFSLSVEEAVFAAYGRTVRRSYRVVYRDLDILDNSLLIQETSVVIVIPLNARILRMPNLPQRVVCGPSDASIHFFPGSRIVLQSECLMVYSPQTIEQGNARCRLWNEMLQHELPDGGFRKFSCPEALDIYCHIEAECI